MGKKGFPAQATLAGTTIEPEQLNELDFLITIDQEKQIIRNILSLIPQGSAAIQLLSSLDVSDFSVFGHTLTTCQDLNQAATLWKTYSQLLLGQMIRNDYMPIGTNIHIIMTPLQPLDRLLMFCMEENLIFGKFLGENLLQTPFHFSELTVTYPPPSYASQYEDYFQCPVTFNARINCIVIEKPPSLCPQYQPDYELHQACLKQCQRILSIAQGDTLWSSRLKLLLSTTDLIPGEQQICKAFHTSSRTLRRHLLAENTSFQKIISEHRHQQACDYLCNTALTPQEIGYLLGYGDCKSFFRAFKGWANVSPGQYRLGCTQNEYSIRAP
jgi:AraC-like DNA-binding protein